MEPGPLMLILRAPVPRIPGERAGVAVGPEFVLVSDGPPGGGAAGGGGLGTTIALHIRIVDSGLRSVADLAHGGLHHMSSDGEHEGVTADEAGHRAGGIVRPGVS